MFKKIIHQLSLSETGGVQRTFVQYMLYALKKSGYKHFVYSRHDLSDIYNSVKHYYYNINSSIFNKLKFLYFIYSKNYLLHFYNNLGSESVNKLLKFLPSSNIIFHERGNVWNTDDQSKKFYQYNSSKAKIIIANSNASKLMLVKRFGVDENKIKIIYNGFLSKNYKFDKKNYKRYSDKFSVGFLGRLDTPKGVHVFINSAKKLPDYDFFIAGYGVLENELKNLAKGQKNIYFLGREKEPMNFISKIDIMVVPSIREPLGNTVIEAGYCKKPVIAANVDGIAEIIDNEISGILLTPDKDISFDKLPKNATPFPKVVINPITQKLVKPKEINADKLCKSIIKLALNEPIRKKYGENLYKTVKEKFNIEDYFEKLEKLYKQI